MCAIWLPSGPIENGTTYIVRPRMQPSNSPLIVLRISAGATQLLVGPASSSRSLQMNVRSSTRATSDGSDAAQKLLGRFAGLSRFIVPLATISSQRRMYSSSLPSHQTIRSGLARAAISRTHSSRRGWRTYAGADTAAARADSESGWFMGRGGLWKVSERRRRGGPTSGVGPVDYHVATRLRKPRGRRAIGPVA